MKSKQTGFTLIETLLVILIIAILGFGGYYVYHTQHSSTKTTAASSVTVPKTTSPKNYFVIKEWGVRAPYSGTQSLQYSLTGSNGETWAAFSSVQLNATGSACQTSEGSAGLIMRVQTGQQYPNTETGQPTGETIDKAVASGQLTSYSRVGNYYYYYVHPQAPCSSATALQQSTISDVESLAAHLQSM